MSIRKLCGCDTFLIGRVQSPKADVIHDGTGKELHILKHDAQRATQIRLVDLPDVDAVKADLAVIDIVETIDQVSDSRLAGARCTDESDLLPRLCPQRDVVKNRLFPVVGEVDVFHDQLTA